MKKIVFTLIITALVSSLFTSCLYFGPSVSGNGNVVEEVRDVEGFNAIKASRGVNVYISQGGYEKVVVKTDENVIDAIETKVENGVLTITTNKNIRHATTNKVYVTIDEIEKISGFAGSNIYTESFLKADMLELSSSAGSNLKLEVKARDMEVSASAGANIFLEGETENIKLSASAGSNIKAEDLVSQYCRAKASSGANIYITVENRLEGRANSGGNVFYSGNPKRFDISNSSGGNVKAR
ncbi:MAG: DUF2807 domain-containing protein [Prolixibacteraceae bacterium]|nr:DUF2807 domain-containing protein [Prolixibacteraceae bacterium]